MNTTLSSSHPAEWVLAWRVRPEGQLHMFKRLGTGSLSPATVNYSPTRPVDQRAGMQKLRTTRITVFVCGEWITVIFLLGI